MVYIFEAPVNAVFFFFDNVNTCYSHVKYKIFIYVTDMIKLLQIPLLHIENKLSHIDSGVVFSIIQEFNFASSFEGMCF